jgi:hypothetical protein
MIYKKLIRYNYFTKTFDIEISSTDDIFSYKKIIIYIIFNSIITLIIYLKNKKEFIMTKWGIPFY